MPYHLVLHAKVAVHEALRPERELGVLLRPVVVRRQVPAETQPLVVVEDEAFPVAVAYHAELRVHRETLVREIVYHLHGDAVGVARKGAGGQLAEDIEVPGVAEALGDGHHLGMHLALERTVSVIIYRYRNLVGQLHPRPQRNFESRRELPERLVYLIDNEVLQRDLGVDRYGDLAEIAVELLRLLQGVPASVQPLGRIPQPVARVICHRKLWHVIICRHDLDRAHVGAVVGELHHAPDFSQPLDRQLVIVGLQGVRTEIRRRSRADIQEARIHKLHGHAVRRRFGRGPDFRFRGEPRSRERQRGTERYDQDYPVHQLQFIPMRTSEVSSFMFLS